MKQHESIEVDLRNSRTVVCASVSIHACPVATVISAALQLQAILMPLLLRSCLGAQNYMPVAHSVPTHSESI